MRLSQHWTCSSGCAECDSARCKFFVPKGTRRHSKLYGRDWRCSRAAQYGDFCGLHRPATAEAMEMTYNDVVAIARHHLPFNEDRELEIDDLRRIAHLLPLSLAVEGIWNELVKRRLTKKEP